MPMSLLGDSLLAAARMFSHASGPDVSYRRHTGQLILTDNRPQSILFTDMVRACTERFLSADGEASSVHQIPKELPAFQRIR